MIDDMAVYIANLGKYNEGYLVGAWFTFPIDEEDVKEKIGLNEQYEEYAIHDTDNFPIAIGEYVSIEELNEMYEMIEELPDYIVECLDEFISHYGTLALRQCLPARCHYVRPELRACRIRPQQTGTDAEPSEIGRAHV